MSDPLVLILILFVLLSGYCLGRMSNRQKAMESTVLSWPQQRYFEGLTHLLKEETDESIDHFVTEMDINADTLDVHLALGNLLRRKGEITRAVKVHQNLLSKSTLNISHIHLVQLELAKDFMHSGLLDRAESLLRELIAQDTIEKPLQTLALEKLIDVYQDTHEWSKAIDIADYLASKKLADQSDKWRAAQAHYSCELALEAQSNQDWHNTHKWISEALRYDKNCVRASLLQAQLDMDDGKYRAAITSLKHIPKQNTELVSEMIAPLLDCHQNLGSIDVWQDDLDTYLKKHRDLRALHLLVQVVSKNHRPSTLLGVLEEYLPLYTDMAPLSEIVRLFSQDAQLTKQHFEQFASALEKFLEPIIEYECSKCGYIGSHIHWHCPSCKQWSTMRLR